jgi:RNA polymerase sigma-70 factor (ECF subfamily)
MSHEEFTDRQFVERLKRSDRETLTQVVETYLPQLLRTARGMGFSREQSEDLAQTVFLAMIESISRFEGRSHIRTFIFGIFYNKVSEFLRQQQKDQHNDPIEDVMETRFDLKGNWRQPPEDIDGLLFGSEAAKMIEDCLQSVPLAQRAAFYLREVEEMTTAEICKKMSIGSTNLGVLLFRARNRLRECLERRGLKRS